MVQNKVNDECTFYCDMVAEKVQELVRKADKDEIRRKANDKAEENKYIKEKFEEGWKDWIEEIKTDIKVDKSEQKKSM